LGLCTGSLHAQGLYPGAPYNPASRPAFSPYLNLLRRDVPLVTNYYGLVRPEVTFRNAIQQLDQQQAITSNQQTTLENALTLPPTGHASQFMTHTKYFLNKGGAGVGSRFVAPTMAGPGAPTAQAAPPAKGARH